MKKYFTGAIKIFAFTLVNASVFSTGLFWLVWLSWNNSIAKITGLEIGLLQAWFLCLLCVMLFKTNMVAHTNNKRKKK